MNLFITLLTIVEVIVCLLLSLLVLMQRPRQEGLGAAFGSGVTDQMFGGETTNVLQKATVYLGIALFGLTFLLAILISRKDNRAETFVEPSDKVVVPAAGKDGTAPGSPEEAIRQTLEKELSKKAAEGNTTPPPASTAPAPPAADKPAAPATDKPAPPAADKPATPAPIPAPTNSPPPVPAVPAPAK